MCSSLRLGEVKGPYLLLVKKISSVISSSEKDKKVIKGIVCFFRYILFLAVSQNPCKKDDREQSFDSFSTKDFLGQGYENLVLIIKNQKQELFVLKKTEKSLIISKKGDLEINILNLEKMFSLIEIFLSKDILFDKDQGVMMVSDNLVTIHSTSIQIINNQKEIFYLSF